jgi:transposase
MLSVASEAEVYLYTAAADMRLGFDRLSEKIRTELKRTPLAGGYFVFFSRSRRKVRILYWDRDGYVFWMKRLEAGSFKIEVQDGYEQITGIDLQEILSGIELSRIKLRKKVEKGLFVSA